MITLTMLKSFLVNLSLSIIKILGAFFGESKTLIADAVHSVSDMTTDIIGLIGSVLSSKKPDENHPFGHGKIEYITSILMSFLIISLGISVLINTLKGKNMHPNIYAVIVLILGIIIKLLLSTYLLKKGKELNSNIVKTNGIESRYDAYSSCLSLIFVVTSLLGTKYKFLSYADFIGGLLMSVLTLKVGINILKENLSSVIGEVETDKEKLDEIKEIVKQNKEITKIRRVTILKYGSYNISYIDIIMPQDITLKEAYNIEKKIKQDLKRSNLNIRYVTVNIKPKK